MAVAKPMKRVTEADFRPHHEIDEGERRGRLGESAGITMLSM